MKATQEEAVRNDRELSITKTGYGHWRIGCLYRGKRYYTVTSDSEAIDDFNSDQWEKDGREYRRLRGYKHLCGQVIRKINP